MPPALAATLTIFAIALLLRWEARQGEARGAALWVPVLWLVITGSRFVSQWINLGEWSSSADTEGSPVDALYFLTLMVIAVRILARRGVRVGEVIRANRWLAAMVIYACISIAWSDFPFVAAKRWVKTLGHPLMALLIVTEPDPAAALRVVLKRCAFIMLPLSVLFVKYYPQYGRSFDTWSGIASNNGIGLTKNDLGYVCMVCGIFFSWNLLGLKRLRGRRERWVEGFWSLVFLWTTFWLLGVSDSKTSLATMLIGTFSMIALGWRFVNKRWVGTYVVVLLVIALTLDSAFDLYAQVLGLLGRNASLTDRTVVWADVIAMQQQPLFGYGFESFWLGQRLEVLWAKFWWRPIQAHNGYIETYLNLGLIGVCLLVGLLLDTFRRITSQMSTDFELARLKFALLLAIIAFNYTEAAFKAVHFIWTMFYIVAMQYPTRHRAVEPRSRRP